MTQTNQAPLVIKLGGAALSCTQTLSQLFGAIAAYQKSAQRQIAIVHGGGYLVDELMAKLQLETVKKNGLRVTPYEQIPVIAGALAGPANKLLKGQMMNVNADQAAVAVAGALDAELVLLSDVSGVLDGKGHLIKTLSEQEADALIQGQVITDGMIVKVKAALEAANDLGRPIEVATWRYPEKLPQLFAGESIGTQFLPQ